MPQYAVILITLFASYLIGSLSPSILFCKIKGVNIMEKGSGNAGTTNVLRIMGPKIAILVFILDVLKGAGVVLISAVIFGTWISYFAAVGVLLGHCFSIYHKFKAGKGIAPGFGAMLAVDWRIGLCVLGVTIVFLLISKKMSVGSLMAAASLPIFAYCFQIAFFPFSCFLSALVIFTHRTNIKRIFNDEEKPLWGTKKKA